MQFRTLAIGGNPDAVGDGIAPSVEPLARLVTRVMVTVGTATASLVYAGLTPGGIGLYQIDFTVLQDRKTSTQAAGSDFHVQDS
jgi:uncharacterized protein (TIGR03437 family)